MELLSFYKTLCKWSTKMLGKGRKNMYPYSYWPLWLRDPIREKAFENCKYALANQVTPTNRDTTKLFSNTKMLRIQYGLEYWHWYHEQTWNYHIASRNMAPWLFFKKSLFLNAHTRTDEFDARNAWRFRPFQRSEKVNINIWPTGRLPGYGWGYTIKRTSLGLQAAYLQLYWMLKISRGQIVRIYYRNTFCCTCHTSIGKHTSAQFQVRWGIYMINGTVHLEKTEAVRIF